MHRIETRIDIAATAERVWSLLVDFESYPRWNPFIRSIEGRLEVGATLTIFIQPPGSRAMRFRPTLLAVDPTRELRWMGRLLMPGVFDGEHCFRLENGPGGVVFRHEETCTGILVPFVKRSLDGATRQGFIAMNQALKREAEKPTSPA